MVTISVVTLVIAGAAVLAVTFLGFLLYFERWKGRHTQDARRDAAMRSQAVTIGKVYEQLIPYLPHFDWNPKDARFVGAPVDFIVFDGLSEGKVREVIFVEVKTGTSTLNARERLVRDAITRGRVEWRELRLPEAQAAARTLH
jgi:predicted Holliday junction resolvase-like endonuclease